MRAGWFVPVAAAWLLAVAPLAAQTVTVAVDGVEREVPVVERQGRRFVALETVARLLGGRVAGSGPERAVLEVDDARLLVHRRVPYVEHGGRWYQMMEAAQKDATGFYLPASALQQLLPTLWPGRFPAVSTSGPPRALPADVAVGAADGPGAADPDLERVDVWVGSERTRLGFRLARTPGVTVEDAVPGILRLHLAGVSVPASVAAGLEGVGLVDSAAVQEAAGGTALTLWLDPAATVYAVAPLRRPAGVELVFRSGAPDEAAFLLAADTGVRRRPPGPAAREATRGETAMEGRGEMVTASDRPGPARPLPETPLPDGEPATGRDAPAGEASAPPPAPRAGWTIVLDAGHGGEDPGAIGPRGTPEKAVTLAVTRALGERLAEQGVHVILTREGDDFVALGERTKIANRSGADLFVSIHANSAGRSAEGYETYFLSAAKTEDAKRVARMENAAIRYEDPEIDPQSLDELNFILRDLAQNEYLRESSALAETIQEELNRRLPLKSRGVKQAGFFVLNGAFMPAILFEMAFISNPREESLLNDRAFRTRLVDGLAEGLLGYLDQYGRKVLAQRAAR